MTTCKQPDCNRELPTLAVQHNDPFCSSTCCKLFHGVVMASQPGGMVGKQTGYMKEYNNSRAKPKEHQKMQVVGAAKRRGNPGVRKYD